MVEMDQARDPERRAYDAGTQVGWGAQNSKLEMTIHHHVNLPRGAAATQKDFPEARKCTNSFIAMPCWHPTYSARSRCRTGFVLLLFSNMGNWLRQTASMGQDMYAFGVSPTYPPVPLPLPHTTHTAMRPPSTTWRGPRRAVPGAASITLLCLLSCLGPASASQPSLLKRWTQTFGLGLGSTTAATTASGTVSLLDAATFTQAKGQEFVDSWATQPNLRVLSQMMEGDRFGVLTNMANDKGLEEIWSKPWAFHRMLQTFPMLEGIKGFPELMAKEKEDLTPEDVRGDEEEEVEGMEGGEGGRVVYEERQLSLCSGNVVNVDFISSLSCDCALHTTALLLPITATLNQKSECRCCLLRSLSPSAVPSLPT